MKKHNSRNRGFSLIEISIALVIIGIVVGGVIFGNNMLNQARINSVQSQAVEYAESARKFEEIYGGLPGDFANASVTISGLSAIHNGNGNGILETNADTNGDGTGDGIDETTLFWRHLQAAKLYKGEVITVGTKSLAKSQISNSGYEVAQDPEMGLSFKLTSYSAGAMGYAAIEASDAWNIDKNYDDGLPESGFIRAETGTAAASNCFTGTAYNSISSDLNCELTIMPTSMLAQGESFDAADLSESKACGDPGDTRVSTSEGCPAGTQGKVIETCTKDYADNTWKWRTTRRSCVPLTCGGGIEGETREIGCPDGYSGSLTQVCEDGIWENQDNPAVACTTQNVVGAACSPNGLSQTLVCPTGQQGTRILVCSAAVWTEAVNTCANIQCAGGAAIGDSRTVSCPAEFEATGSITESCAESGQWLPVSNNCVLRQDQACPTAGATRTAPDVNCPSGMAGSIVQKCKDVGGTNKWQTIQNSCAIENCFENKPVGYSRKSDENCPVGKVGKLIEVCQANGSWATSTINCTSNICLGSLGGTDGNARWPDSIAPTSPVAGFCISGTGTPTRDCNADTSWGAVTGACSSNAEWVAVGHNGSGSGVALHSSDGSTWNSVVLPNTAFCEDVAYNGSDLWVAACDDGRLFSSANGVSWTENNLGITHDFRAIEHNKLPGASGLWVAALDGTRNTYTSTDGLSWTLRTNASPSSQNSNLKFNGIPGTKGLWILTSFDNTVATSTNGITWTTQVSPFTDASTDIQSIEHNWSGSSGRWVMAGSDAGTNKIFYSANGTSWTAGTLPAFGSCEALEYVDGTWICGSNLDCTSSTSADGQTFTSTGTAACASAASSKIFWDFIYNGKTAADKKILSVAAENRIYSSANGNTWTDVSPTGFNGFLRNIEYKLAPNSCTTNPTFANATVTGTDSDHGDSRTVNCNSGYSGGPFTVYCNNGSWVEDTTVSCTQTANWVASGHNNAGRAAAIYSVDGDTWTTVLLGTAPTTSCETLDYDGVSRWVMACNNSRLFTSTDGITWSEINMTTFGAAASRNFFAVAHNRQTGGAYLWVAMHAGSNDVYTSTNGTTWTRNVGVAAVNISQIMHNGLSGADGMWVMVGYDSEILTSTNGTSWTARTSPVVAPAAGASATDYQSIAHNGLTGASGIWALSAVHGAGGASSGRPVYSTNNGVTWSQGSGLDTWGDCQGLTYHDGRFLCGDQWDCRTSTSTTGNVYSNAGTSSASCGQRFNALASNGLTGASGKVIGFSWNGRIYKSTNGMTGWTRVSAGFTGFGRNVQYKR